MKKSKSTEQQIVFALKQAETGILIAEVCRKIGISEATFFNWKQKFSGLGTAAAAAAAAARRRKQSAQAGRCRSDLGQTDAGHSLKPMQFMLIENVLKKLDKNDDFFQQRSLEMPCQCSVCRGYPRHLWGFSSLKQKTSRLIDTYLLKGQLLDVELNNHFSRFSVRWVKRGKTTYEIDGRRFKVSPGRFLLTNNGQRYTCVSERNEATECFTISFHPALLKNVFNGLSREEEWLLDNPFDN